MDLAEIKAKFKWNFLKNVIFRLDFEKIDEAVLDLVLQDVGPYVEERGFDRRFEKINNDVEIKLPTSGKDITSEIRSRHKIYCFMNDANGMSVELSISAILLSINSSAYIPFTYYFSIFSKLFSILSSHSRTIIVKRVGLRKINKCLLSSLETLNEVVNEGVFSVHSWDDKQFPLNCIKSESIEIEDLKANISRQLLPGKIGDDVWYQFTLDTDAYCDNSEAISLGLKDNNNMCARLNDLLFKFYTESLNAAFIEKLMKDDFEDDKILGVESNG